MIVDAHNFRPSQGFTLIEVLLALSVFTVLLTAMHMVFYAALRLRNKTAGAIEQSLPVEQTLGIIKRDLANIVVPGGTFFGQLQTTGTSTNAQTSSGQPADQLGMNMPGQSSPDFYTAVGMIDDNSPWAEVQKVSYYLVPSTNFTIGQDLIRSVTRNLLPVMQEEPVEQFLMAGVESIFFSFYDGSQWRESWDSTIETSKLPQAIRVELQMATPEELDLPKAQLPIQLIVPLMAQASTNQTETASSGGTGGQR